MASYHIPPPEPMNIKGDVAAHWKNFKSEWAYYLVATELDDKDGRVQAAALCKCMGMDCVKIMQSLTTLTVEDAINPERIIAELDAHFTPQKHLLFERVKFGNLNQTENESIDQFVVRLRQAADTCEFAGLNESLMRDRLVIGTHDAKTRDRLLRERPVPDLGRCIELLRASELSKAHKDQLHRGETASASSSSVHHINRTHRTQRRNKDTQHKTVHNKPSNTRHSDKSFKPKTHNDNSDRRGSTLSCKYCATKHPFSRDQCPAFGQRCKKCGLLNHFAKACFKKNIHHTEMNSEFESVDSVFTCQRQVSSRIDGSTQFKVPLKFNQCEKTAQLDTGATCSCMSYRDLCDILAFDDVKLDLLRGKIRLYDQSIIQLLGSYTLKVKRDHGNECKITFDIVDRSPWPIIDGKTCVEQGWISVHSEEDVNMTLSEKSLSLDEMLSEYADVFSGLGCLPGEYHIDVDPDVKPLKPVQHAPRRVPVPLRSRLKEKIDDMERLGIIAKVTTPTDWISSLVAVQKPNKLRVCIDPKDLNRAIKRPKYQMPVIEEILPKLAKAKVFSVLDARDGFYQVKLDEESSYLTTFWTPFGRYRYLRMPQGISSAPEEYQRRQTEVLSGLSGVEVIHDIILCYGSGETVAEAQRDHDLNLLQLLKRARTVNLKLNKKKLRTRLPEVPYMGQLLTSEGLKPDPSKVRAMVEMPRPVDKKSVQRLLGCVNYLSKFMPKLADVCVKGSDVD